MELPRQTTETCLQFALHRQSSPQRLQRTNGFPGDENCKRVPKRHPLLPRIPSLESRRDDCARFSGAEHLLQGQDRIEDVNDVGRIVGEAGGPRRRRLRKRCYWRAQLPGRSLLADSAECCSIVSMATQARLGPALVRAAHPAHRVATMVPGVGFDRQDVLTSTLVHNMYAVLAVPHLVLISPPVLDALHPYTMILPCTHPEDFSAIAASTTLGTPPIDTAVPIRRRGLYAARRYSTPSPCASSAAQDAGCSGTNCVSTLTRSSPPSRPWPPPPPQASKQDSVSFRSRPLRVKSYAGRRIRAVLNIHVYMFSTYSLVFPTDCICNASPSPSQFTRHPLRRAFLRLPFAHVLSTFLQPLRRRRVLVGITSQDPTRRLQRATRRQCRRSPEAQLLLSICHVLAAIVRALSASPCPIAHDARTYMHPLAQRAEDPPPDGMMQRARLGADVPRERDTMIARGWGVFLVEIQTSA
ncbi:hypothetical protein C8R46DRAFT_1275388 [Mycena filopes]|nr:hypothetical protein C8R46DRAFT_1275388 [Mycena filopes]